MDKFYIQLFEILKNYGIPFDFIFEHIKSGRLKIYSRMGFNYYLENFDDYIDKYILNRKKEIDDELESKHREYNIVKNRISYPGALNDRLFDFLDDKEINEVNKKLKRIKNSIQNINNQKFNLENKEEVGKELSCYFFINSNELQLLLKNINHKSGGRKKDTERIEKTKKACIEVEKLYRELLSTTKKPIIKSWVQNEMSGINPHNKTFNDWFRRCEFTKGAGNPHKK